METINKIVDIAEKECQKKGERLTKKRKAVLLALLQSQKAISAYELVDYCKTQFDEIISAMSIYRILVFLQDQGLAHRLDSENKYVACSYITCGHKHKYFQFLICEQCQRVEEINIDPSTLQDLQTDINKIGFHSISPQLEIHGVCNKCFSTEKTTAKAP